MNGRRTQALWHDRSRGERYDAVPFPSETEVVVVGAGLTGILTAHKLVHAGKRVLLLDMDQVGCGETGHSTAHVTWLWDAGYRALRDRFNQRQARTALRAHHTACAELAELARAVPCDFAEVPAFLYATNDKQYDDLRKEHAAILNLGGAAEIVEDVPLPFAVSAAMRVDNSWQCNPLTLARTLLEEAVGENCRVAEGVRVKPVEDKGKSCIVRTSHGNVECENVVYATHSPINFFALHTKQAAYRTYVLALRSTRDVGPGLFLDMEDPYHYFRRHTDHEGSSVLLVGGADHKTGDKADAPFHALEVFAEQRFGPSRVQYTWSGQILEPFDGLPFIGLNPGDAHVYVATGYSGTGISAASLASAIISDAILQRPNAWSNVFSPSRLKPVTQRRYITENIDTPAHLIMDKLAGHSDVQAIRSDEGALIKHGMHTWAVYRDNDNALHAFSPVCPHMGCHVQWNSLEKTWDCPCHGSRFSAAEGRVLNGPSTEDLTEMSSEGEAELAHEHGDEKGHGI